MLDFFPGPVILVAFKVGKESCNYQVASNLEDVQHSELLGFTGLLTRGLKSSTAVPTIHCRNICGERAGLRQLKNVFNFVESTWGMIVTERWNIDGKSVEQVGQELRGNLDEL